MPTATSTKPPPLPQPERYEKNPQPTAIPLFAGWVCYRVRGWQRIVHPRADWLARLDLADYLEFVGDAAVDSVILPEGERP
ncbi:MAG TPA: hypothetical protein VGZ47_00945 [Gemmataceae bacterium]|jgi:hypothetical protein|nr:hypothetical protein [Gemmataceae bacterium]